MTKNYQMKPNTVKVLAELESSEVPLSVLELSERSGIDKTVVRGIIASLSKEGVGLVTKHDQLGSQPKWSLKKGTEVDVSADVESDEETLLRVLVSREKGFPKNIRLTFTRMGEESLPQEVLVLSPVTITIREGVSDNPSFLNVCSLRVDTLDQNGEVMESFIERLNKGEALFVTEGV